MKGLKTKKGVAKRFKLTKKGKVKYFPCGKSHLASSKNAKRLRNLRKARTIGDRKTRSFLKRMLPYA
ncbi:MAG: 50S ribosomal protein L35 [Candidatus Omnitrophota bacterium]|jgi:large subunit ribosomal protein L35|nr:MAG: 50S ribosomal protein L35 [Candidatus Omnitrophota bacterium]